MAVGSPLPARGGGFTSGGSGGAVVLTTAGSLGDLYPVLSIAASLEEIGVEARLLLSPDDCDVARGWGLRATAIGPTRAQICAILGRTEDQMAGDFFRNPLPFLRRVAIPAMADLLPQLEEACVGATCVSGTFLAFGAAFAAEKARLPYVPLLLQPMLAWSARAPASGPGFDLMVRAPGNAATRGYNRALLGAVELILRAGLRGPMNRLRADAGLPRFAGTPLIEPGGAAVPLRLGLWSEAFSAAPPDAPPGLEVVGFPRSPRGLLSDHVRTWLDDGPPPLVVTLGSVAQTLGGEGFYDRAVELARHLGLRTLVLHGNAAPPRHADDVLALPRAAHAPLLPQAAAILHHGGMGTTAEALRSGRPQLVMPIGGDQPDNAARLESLGVAAILDRKRFTVGRVLPQARALLAGFDRRAATDLGDRIAAEDGAEAAAKRLATISGR